MISKKQKLFFYYTFLFVLTIILNSSFSFAQNASTTPKKINKMNEKTIFSFLTLENKTVIVAYEVQQNYIVFKYGTDDNIEVEIRESKTTAEKKFTYSFFKRGTIKHTNYLDLNYLNVNSGSIQYVLFEDYIALSTEPEIGIIITDANLGERKEIRGNLATKKGSLSFFKEHDDFVEISTNVYR